MSPEETIARAELVEAIRAHAAAISACADALVLDDGIGLYAAAVDRADEVYEQLVQVHERWSDVPL